VSKASRRTEPPEVLRGQSVNYDDTAREMRASLTRRCSGEFFASHGWETASQAKT
jgi:hypothetical protein